MKGKIVDRNDERLSALKFALRSAPPKEKRHGSLSLKAAVEELLPDLIAMRHKGYTDAELADMMTRSGFEIAAGTLKNYINKGKTQISIAISTEVRTPARPVPDDRDAQPDRIDTRFDTGPSRIPDIGLRPSQLPPKLAPKRRSTKRAILGHKLNEDV